MKRESIATLRRMVKKARVVTVHDVVDAFRKSSFTSLQPRFESDAKYRALSDGNWERLLYWANLSRHKWVAEYRDCDDFARYCRGKLSVMALANGCGVLLDSSGGHAFNFAIVDRGDEIELRAFEPQACGRLPRSGVWVSKGETRNGIAYPLASGAFVL